MRNYNVRESYWPTASSLYSKARRSFIDQVLIGRLTVPLLEAMDRSADRQRDFDAFVVSAKGEMSTRSFRDWAGGERVTLAIVFTDVVGSTSLGVQLRDEAMNEVRRAHFAQSQKLIERFKGREIKTLGDGFMTAFKSADAALNYALAL